MKKKFCALGCSLWLCFSAFGVQKPNEVMIYGDDVVSAMTLNVRPSDHDPTVAVITFWNEETR